MAQTFNPGDRVVICAADDFFAFVDGWHGTVAGQNNGLVEVKCVQLDGVKTLFVPADQLALSV